MLVPCGIYKREELPCPYDEIEAVNWSTLKHILTSPKHYQHAVQRRFRDKQQMLQGRANHVATLEPELFEEQHRVWDSKWKLSHGVAGKPDKQGRPTVEVPTTGAKLLVKVIGSGRPRSGAPWEEFKARAERDGVDVLTETERDLALAVQFAVRNSPDCQEFLAEGEPEVTLVWTDPETGVLLKGRVDWVGQLRGRTCFSDLKGTADVGWEKFSSALWRMLYHAQQSLYATAHEVLTGEFPDVAVLAHEMDAPHDSVPYLLDQETLERGKALWQTALRLLVGCRAKDYWPGIAGKSPGHLPIPSWVDRQEKQRRKTEGDEAA